MLAGQCHHRALGVEGAGGACDVVKVGWIRGHIRFHSESREGSEAEKDQSLEKSEEMETPSQIPEGPAVLPLDINTRSSPNLISGRWASGFESPLGRTWIEAVVHDATVEKEVYSWAVF